MEIQHSKIMGHDKDISKMEIYSNTGLTQETRKISNEQSNLTPKELEWEQQTKPKVSRRKEILTIRVEINEIKIKKIEKINETKRQLLKE